MAARLLLYFLARLVLFAAAVVLLGAVGVRGVPLAAGALLISIPLAYVLLARKRSALTEAVERRAAVRPRRRSRGRDHRGR